MSGRSEATTLFSVLLCAGLVVGLADCKKQPLSCKTQCSGRVCGDDGCGGECAPGCPSGQFCRNGACADPEVVDTDGLIAVLNQLEFQFADMYRPRGPALLDITYEYTVAGEATVSATDISDPCGGDPQCGYVGFVLFGSVPGVTLDASRNATFRDTTVRFRGILQDNHPDLPAVFAVIQIIPSASEPCPEGITRCLRDYVCYENFGQHCAYCTDFPSHMCACRSFEGERPEGEPCDFFMSGDVVYSGRCLGGECQNCRSNGDCIEYPSDADYCWARAFVDPSGQYFVSLCQRANCVEGACGPSMKCCGQDQCVHAESTCPD